MCLVVIVFFPERVQSIVLTIDGILDEGNTKYVITGLVKWRYVKFLLRSGVKSSLQSCPTFMTAWTYSSVSFVHELLARMPFGVGCHALLQGYF